jgi:hypothetical protein
LSTRHNGRGVQASLVVGIGLLWLAPARAAEAPPTEHQVKAAFMLHFARLVSWPGWPRPDQPDHPFEIAVVGRDPFGDQLEATIGASLVQGRPIRIRRVSTVEALERPPQILFVGESGPERVRLALKSVKGRPVLTVGEAIDFAKAGGVVGFRLTPEGRVAFDVNVAQAEEAGLKLSSQLLRVARVVEAKP